MLIIQPDWIERKIKSESERSGGGKKRKIQRKWVLFVCRKYNGPY